MTAAQLQNEIAKLSIRVAALAHATKKAVTILADEKSQTNSDLDECINVFTKTLAECTRATGILAGFEDE